MGSVEYFQDLTVYGWVGILLWCALAVSIYVKQNWYFNYYERKPKLHVFEEYVYTTERQVVFMAVRFILILMFVIGVGTFLTRI